MALNDFLLSSKKETDKNTLSNQRRKTARDSKSRSHKSQATVTRSVQVAQSGNNSPTLLPLCRCSSARSHCAVPLCGALFWPAECGCWRVVWLVLHKTNISCKFRQCLFPATGRYFLLLRRLCMAEPLASNLGCVPEMRSGFSVLLIPHCRQPFSHPTRRSCLPRS